MRTQKFEAPELGKKAFNCPHCGALAQMWFYDSLYISQLLMGKCQACQGINLWIGNKMVYPKSILTPPPTDDMPEEVKKTYNEASQVLNDSPRAACALLRLALEELLLYLQENCVEYKSLQHDTLYKNIDGLAKLGISSRLKKAFEIVRITGNNAIHPGRLDINDNLDIAYALFDLLNIITQETITHPKELDEMFNRVKHPKQKTNS